VSYIIVFRNRQNGAVGVIEDYDERDNPIVATFETYEEAEASQAPILRISDYAIVEAP
jgi:hypothetical protein